jgi:CMP-N-acetylneuraminic acid synthetase
MSNQSQMSKVDIALIPARQGSERLPMKNIKKLNGAPLIAYSIQSALRSEKFNEVIVSTDSPEIATIALDWGARVPSLRPTQFAGSLSPDIEWVRHAIDNLTETPKEEIGCVAILRPTSPLRSPSTIKSAMEEFKRNTWADSLRAMEVTFIHPGKMWRVNEEMEAIPYLDQTNEVIPTHSRPTQSLERLWVQNASLEITRLSSLIHSNSISGGRVMGFEMPELEGFDVNTPMDWQLLEFLAREHPEMIPNLEPINPFL